MRRRPSPRSRPAPPRPVPPAFGQTAGASARERTLFELVRARAGLMAAIQGLTSGAADRPMGAEKWSARETVLHLVTRDEARLRELESARAGRRASWIGTPERAWARINAESLAPLADHAWDDAVRLLQTTRRRLMEALEAVPAEPADVWSTDHPFGEMLAGLPPHDRHHAEAIKTWREEALPPRR